jgi:hypothetical protein
MKKLFVIANITDLQKRSYTTRPSLIMTEKQLHKWVEKEYDLKPKCKLTTIKKALEEGGSRLFMEVS